MNDTFMDSSQGSHINPTSLTTPTAPSFSDPSSHNPTPCLKVEPESISSNPPPTNLHYHTHQTQSQLLPSQFTSPLPQHSELPAPSRQSPQPAMSPSPLTTDGGWLKFKQFCDTLGSYAQKAVLQGGQLLSTDLEATMNYLQLLNLTAQQLLVFPFFIPSASASTSSATTSSTPSPTSTAPSSPSSPAVGRQGPLAALTPAISTKAPSPLYAAPNSGMKFPPIAPPQFFSGGSLAVASGDDAANTEAVAKDDGMATVATSQSIPEFHGLPGLVSPRMGLTLMTPGGSLYGPLPSVLVPFPPLPVGFAGPTNGNASNSGSPGSTSPGSTPPGNKRKRGRPPLDRSNLVCRRCGTRDTPEWRKGPDGGKTLCNACGLQYAKRLKMDALSAAHSGGTNTGTQASANASTAGRRSKRNTTATVEPPTEASLDTGAGEHAAAHTTTSEMIADSPPPL